jgi:hypothetical protein
MPVLKNDSVLYVQVAEGARYLSTDENRKHRLEPAKERFWATWYNNKSGPLKKVEELKATPIDILELPEDLPVTPTRTGAPYSDWYYLERRPKENGIPNEYIVHADDLIPVNFEYPTIVTPSFIKHLQETLALAQLEAARLSQKSELRIGMADRLLIHLRAVGVNVLPPNLQENGTNW